MSRLIETNPKILGGEPVLKGTRIPVARIAALFIQGYKIGDFKKDYPYLNITNDDLEEIFAHYHHQLAAR